MQSWTGRPTLGQISKAKADRNIPDDSNRPDKASMLSAFGNLFDKNWYEMYKDHPRYPPR